MNQNSKYTEYGDKYANNFRCKGCGKFIPSIEITSKQLLRPKIIFKESIEDMIYCKECEKNGKK